MEWIDFIIVPILETSYDVPNLGTNGYFMKYLLLTLLLLSGCASFDKAYSLIQPNDSKTKVIELIGQPEDRQFKGKNEAWQFCRTGTSFGVSGYKVIWFYDGKVTGITTYSLHRAGSCEAHFEPIKWENAPDQVIEVRER